jgi:hypothetical protein
VRCLWLLLVVGSAVACDSTPKRSAPAEPTDPAPASSSVPTGTASSAAPSAAAPGDAPDVEGAWEGRYESKKGSVLVPAGVKDKTWVKDDGKTAIGSGTISLSISSKGEVTGKGKGALGRQMVSGKVDGSMIRASLMPEDPTAADAMTGVLVGAVKEGVIHGEIKVAGPDATVVREAPIELKRK